MGAFVFMSDSYADDGYGEIIPVDSFGLSPTPSAILAMLYFLVCGLSFSKDVVPRVYRWAKQKRYKPRLLMIFCLICFSTLLRAIYFLLISLKSSNDLDPDELTLFLLWWGPEFILIINFPSIIYFWAEVFCRLRGNNLFSFSSFRNQVHQIEMCFAGVVAVLQTLFTVAMIVSPASSQSTWFVMDLLYLGSLSFFVGLLPFTIGLQIYSLSKTSKASYQSLFGRITLVTFLWSIGRFARAFDVFSTMPEWEPTKFSSFGTSSYYWIYATGLYMIMEIIPQSMMLLSSYSSRIDELENPYNLKVLDRKRTLAVLKERVTDHLVPTEAWDFEGDLLGKGAYSNVYSGVLRNEPVAIKNFTKLLQREIGPLESFCREVEILSTLDHPNVVKLKGVHIAMDDHIYMFTELAERGTLNQVLQIERDLCDSQKIQWALQIALGMEYLHANKIIHRDLKTDNILVFNDNVCKICDFGVTAMFRDDLRGTVGTEYWMAPEMLMGEKYDFKVDVYSYGFVLWEILTGDRIQNRREVISGSYQGWRMEGSDVLVETMNCCLESVPENRPDFSEIVSTLSKNRRPKKIAFASPRTSVTGESDIDLLPVN